MKRVIEIAGVIDFLAFIGGIVWVAIRGELPQPVTDFWNATQTAALIIIVLLGIPFIWLVALIIKSQLEPPYER